MAMAFCLDHTDLGDGKRQMTIAGEANLSGEIDPPQPMVLAASMLQIPGFKVSYPVDHLGEE
jgi:hypothetical protein